MAFYIKLKISWIEISLYIIPLYFHNYLIYGAEVWGNTNAVHLDPIIKIQKKIVRTITFSHYLAHVATYRHVPPSPSAPSAQTPLTTFG